MFPFFLRQIVEDERFLEGRPKDFKDFQSSFGFPIFSFSLPSTKFFFLLLIMRCTLLLCKCWYNFESEDVFVTDEKANKIIYVCFSSALGKMTYDYLDLIFVIPVC